jgi:hypothetical protein
MEEDAGKKYLRYAGYILIVLVPIILFSAVPLPNRNTDTQSKPPMPSIPEWNPTSQLAAEFDEPSPETVEGADELISPATLESKFSDEAHRRLAAKLLEKYVDVDVSTLDPPLENWWDEVNAFMLLARACFLGEENDESLFTLLTHPDRHERMMAVQGFLQGHHALPFRQGHSTLNEFFERNAEHADVIAPALIEALHDDSVSMDKGSLPYYLSLNTNAKETSIPHMVWFSKNAEDPQHRIVAMNGLARLDNYGQQTSALTRSLLADPSPIVRLNALQGAILHPLEKAFSE